MAAAVGVDEASLCEFVTITASVLTDRMPLRRRRSRQERGGPGRESFKLPSFPGGAHSVENEGLRKE